MHLDPLRHAEDTDSGHPKKDSRRLTAIGRNQAVRAAAWLRQERVTEVLTGTLERARRTAEIIADRLGLQPEFDRRLNEIDAGTTLPPPRERRPGHCIPGDESWEEFLTRVAAAISDLCRDSAPRRRVLLVTHSGFFDAVHELFQSSAGRPVELAVQHTGITHWEHRPGSPAGAWVLHSHNVAPIWNTPRPPTNASTFGASGGEEHDPITRPT